MKTQKIDAYYEKITAMLAQNLESQRQTMGNIASLWAESILNDHLTYVFGSGHSRFIAGELYWRAGGLASVFQIDDLTLGAAERVEGYAASFMATHNIQPGDLLFVISNSGINALPIEVAQIGKEMGAKVIAVTSLDYSRSAQPRHSSGKKLFEVADIVLDTQNVRGDALVEIDGLQGWKAAPASTIISIALLEGIVAQTAQNVADAGHLPPILLSANVAEGDQHNKELSEKYWQRLTRFPRKDVF
ncbi:MAG: SIS domain-containing protein [Anaerolineaceae bacterium]|nr:SIS domain-containing protein [Anaerolineaceae bacterium]